jgi:hypothetical protein
MWITPADKRLHGGHFNPTFSTRVRTKPKSVVPNFGPCERRSVSPPVT